MHFNPHTETQPPVNTTAALGMNATFSCRGDGKVSWKINNTQGNSADLVPLFAQQHIYIPLPSLGSSELIVTATSDNNFTRAIQCNVASENNNIAAVDSEIVHLLVYGEYRQCRHTTPVQIFLYLLSIYLNHKLCRSISLKWTQKVLQEQISSEINHYSWQSLFISRA